ncbi:fatty acid desaturase [Paraburkholderia sp. SARCC-3016]|uniref:fatty acid desaturase n=1 Tax=Paraburkholderia sp. SARCC-3016 TaxID=3058611 RepID=UPI002807C2A9|nr:fatty acid desaturase [Paraburkholderia sp. SARCC-3016]MDQ7976362.1 fatty acid desaturase [Paraburkholderia sp. SARCC-3016]
MAFYLDDTQREVLSRRRASWTWRSEWPTWLVIVAIYAGWFGAATHARELGMPVTIALLALFGAWYLSLQHELLHGHPTRSPLINGLIGFMPLAVWLPYRVYRELHLRHHDDPHLTRPEHDPESYFVSPDAWNRAGPILRACLTARNTFVGRVLLGPAFSLAATASGAARKLVKRDFSDVPAWLAHGAALAALTTWLARDCGISPWLFIAGAGYPALALNAIRSFHEHRGADAYEHRSVINEAAWYWRLLFLNNNYHAVHHDLPGLPWFALRRIYRERRTDYLLRNGGFLVHGYGDWLASYAAKPVTHPVHAIAQTGAASTRRRPTQPKLLLRRARLQFRRFN